MHFLKKYVLLLTSLCFFILGIYYSLEHAKNNPSTREKLSSINKGIGKELQILNHTANQIKKKLEQKKKLSFYKLNTITSTYPFYIYRNQHILYWSDHHMVPDYHSIINNKTYYFYESSGSQFIVLKKELKTSSSTYTIFILLPLSIKPAIQNRYISSSYHDLLPKNTHHLSNQFDKRWGYNVFGNEGNFLFSISLYPKIQSKTTPTTTSLYFFIFSIFFLLLFSILTSISFFKKKSYWKSLFILLTGISLGIATATYLLLYSYSIFSDTISFTLLKELVISIRYLFVFLLILFVFLIFIDINYVRLRIDLFFNSIQKKYIKYIIAFIGLSISSILVVINHQLINFLFEHYELQNTPWLYLAPSAKSIISICCALLLAFIYILYVGITLKNLLAIWSKTKTVVLLSIIQFLISCIVCLSHIEWLFLLSIHTGYIIILLYLKLIRPVVLLRYSFFIYLLIGVIFTAALTTCSFYFYKSANLKKEKEHIAHTLLIKSTFIDKLILEEISQEIKKDTTLQSLFLSPTLNHLFVVEKIYQKHLIYYTDRYDLNLFLFDKKGKSINPAFKKTYTAFKKDILKTFTPQLGQNKITIYSKSTAQISSYTEFIEIMGKSKNPIAYIIIQLDPRLSIPNSISYPLLATMPLTEQSLIEPYPYAIYQKNQLTTSWGGFDYLAHIDSVFLTNTALFKKGIKRNGLHHQGFKGKDERIVIISSRKSSIYYFFSVFCFFFVNFLIPILIILLGYSIYFIFYKPTLGLISQLQFYLTSSFIIPIVLLSIVIIGIVSINYQQSFKNSFSKKAESISTQLTSQLESYTSKKINKESFYSSIYELSSLAQADIHLYSTNGRLLFSSQPILYERHFLSNFINPIALSTITELRIKQIVLKEHIGKFYYNTTYTAIRSFKTGKLIGILSIPFFDSQTELNKQLANIINTSLVIFTIVFLILMLLLYTTSTILITPLRLLTEKIKQTTLVNKNTPLSYSRQDELGLLINEYNKMLITLEENKKSVSEKEKEIAWQEMAQQVAHEIKNPLTPMKLILQHIKKIIKEVPEESKKIVSTSIDRLLEQVDRLNEIATSFSDFAGMPHLELKEVDLCACLENTIELYKLSNPLIITYHITPSPCLIWGDKQLLQRIFLNLISNALEAIPTDRKGAIIIRLDINYEMKNAYISIKDNGIGISESVKENIFNPYFSTKTSGTGIGLAIVKRGIEQMNGKIMFQTEENKGTEFIIQFPIL